MQRFTSFQNLIDIQSEKYPDKPIFLYDDNGRRIITWKEFSKQVYQRSAELKKAGHTCMGLLADGSLDSIIELFAANIAGLQIVMLDHTMPTPAVGRLLAYTDADCLYASPVRKAELTPFLTKGVSNGSGNILFFTSGTTSQSKAVVLTDRSLMASAWNGSAKLPLETYDILLNLLPLAHVFGMVCGLLWGMNCGAVVALGRGPRHYIDDLTFYRPTAVSVVPLLLNFLYSHHLFNRELRLILVGAGDCSSDLLNAVKAEKIQIAFGYGLTETSSGVAISTHDDPSAMEVCPDDKIRLAEDGEILIEAPTCIMKGYYKKEAETKQVLQEGVLHTGDLGRFDENNRLHITGRKKDILVLPNGTKIYLPEYEMAIMKALSHQDIAVILKNNRPVLVTGNIKETREQIKEKLEDFMKTLPHGQQLTGIIQLDHPLARTATGKLQRWQLQKEIENDH